MSSDSLARCVDCRWCLADPGNGEQASWWCWAVARLRKSLGLNPVPEPVSPDEMAAYIRSRLRTPPVEMTYVQASRGLTVTLLTEPNPKYPAGGAAALVDGLRGTMDLSGGQWLGFQGSDFEAQVDLGRIRHISEVTVGLLHDPDAWIFLPKRLALSVSDDGSHFREVTALGVTPRTMERPEIRNAPLLTGPIDSRFLRVRAENFGVCPPWHKAAGRKCWLFIDEIEIR